MNIKDVLEFANKYPSCFLATVDGEKPKVRGFLMWFADETGFYFHTGSMKRIYKQIKTNQEIEVCFFSPQATAGGKMLRVSGEVEIVSDIGMKEKLVVERPFLKAIHIENADDPLILFRISHGEAFFWTMEINTRESEAEVVRF
jgi:pyridoxamine 5'-phosphate oxidase